ncbi:MAG TPA: GFA family protein [Solirubrobacteraceae bacterium]|nr:GFA family protein [Solirubrobacteraceae bacterium]
MTRTASCSCGQLTVTTEGEPVRVSVCHCGSCQKRTGSVFGAQARFPAAAVTVSGEYREYVRISDEGDSRTFRFCPECGGTVFYSVQDVPDHLSVAVGAFADPDFPAPTVSVWESRRHPWVSVPTASQRLD